MKQDDKVEQNDKMEQDDEIEQDDKIEQDEKLRQDENKEQFEKSQVTEINEIRAVDSSIELKMSDEDNDEKSLDELLADVDIDDPQSMNIIAMFKDQLDIEDEHFMDIIISKLDDMLIIWDQPWYQQHQGVTRPIAQVENNLAFNTGRIRKEEADKIQRNWRKFVRKYDIPNKPDCFARWRAKRNVSKHKTPHEKARHFVTAFLAKGLKRTLSQVYKYFITKHAYTKKGPYTSSDEKVIKICLKHVPDNATVMASYVLNREPRQIYNKIAEINNGKTKNGSPSKKSKSWNLGTASAFLNSLLKHTGLTIEKLKNKEIEMKVWTVIAEELERDKMQLRNFWYLKLHQQLFLDKAIKLHTIRKEIYLKLANRLDSLKLWSDISWKDLAKEFPDGFTKEFIYQMAYRPFRYNKSILKKPLGEALEYVSDKANGYNNKRMKLLEFDSNGKLMPRNKKEEIND